MPTLDQITAVWRNIKEFELAPIRKEALRELNIVLIGNPQTDLEQLARQMQHEPHIAGYEVHSTVRLLPLDQASQAQGADLILLLLDPSQKDYHLEQALCREWGNAGRKTLLICNSDDPEYDAEKLRQWAPWGAAAFMCGPLAQEGWLQKFFVPAVLKLLPDRHLALGRQFPLFRMTIAHQLIKDTCYSNAAYALGSGLAEIVPVLNLPLNITDMIVLTKAQAFLVYRLGLLLGFSTAWQDYIAEFGSVIGGGFIWRQLARYLVGLIPVWGVLPKVAVAYAGTFVVGNAVLQWYLTGRHLNPSQMRALYRQALAEGKHQAQNLVKKLPKPRLPKPGGQRSSRKQLESLPPLFEIPLDETAPQICSACGRPSAPDARFCQYCGRPLGAQEA